MVEYAEAQRKMYENYKERVGKGELKEPTPEEANTSAGLAWKQWEKIRNEVEGTQDKE